MARNFNEYKYHFIYKTTCIITGSFYIGMRSTNNINDSYLGGGNHLINSLKKYGRKNHCREILEYLPDRISLGLKEKEIVDKDLLKDPFCMNLVEGGEGGFNLSDEHVKNFSKSGHEAFKKKLQDPLFKKKFSETSKFNTLKNIEAGKIKLPNTTGLRFNLTEDAKRKIGIANSIHQSEEGNSQYGKYWIYKNDEVLRINSSEEEKYLLLGWKRGKKNTKRERHWIYKDGIRKRINGSDLEDYINSGWIKK